MSRLPVSCDQPILLNQKVIYMGEPTVYSFIRLEEEMSGLTCNIVSFGILQYNIYETGLEFEEKNCHIWMIYWRLLPDCVSCTQYVATNVKWEWCVIVIAMNMQCYAYGCHGNKPYGEKLWHIVYSLNDLINCDQLLEPQWSNEMCVVLCISGMV